MFIDDNKYLTLTKIIFSYLWPELSGAAHSQSKQDSTLIDIWVTTSLPGTRFQRRDWMESVSWVPSGVMFWLEGGSLFVRCFIPIKTARALRLQITVTQELVDISLHTSTLVVIDESWSFTVFSCLWLVCTGELLPVHSAQVIFIIYDFVVALNHKIISTQLI